MVPLVIIVETYMGRSMSYMLRGIQYNMYHMSYPIYDILYNAYLSYTNMYVYKNIFSYGINMCGHVKRK